MHRLLAIVHGMLLRGEVASTEQTAAVEAALNAPIPALPRGVPASRREQVAAVEDGSGFMAAMSAVNG